MSSDVESLPHILMWVKQCHKPSMAGNGKHTTYTKMVMTEGWFMALFYPHSSV